MNEKKIKKIKVRQDLQSEFEGTIDRRKAIFRTWRKLKRKYLAASLHQMVALSYNSQNIGILTKTGKYQDI